MKNQDIRFLHLIHVTVINENINNENKFTFKIYNLNKKFKYMYMKNVVANWTTNYIYKSQCLCLIKVRVLMKSRFHFSIIHKCMAHVPKCYILSPSYIRFCAACMEIQFVCTYLFKKENKIKRFLNWYSNVHWPNRIRCSSFIKKFLYECDLIIHVNIYYNN